MLGKSGLEHLTQLGVTPAELAFTERHLARLLVTYSQYRSQIELASAIASIWSVTK